jgi:hypothetical protein
MSEEPCKFIPCLPGISNAVHRGALDTVLNSFFTHLSTVLVDSTPADELLLTSCCVPQLPLPHRLGTALEEILSPFQLLVPPWLPLVSTSMEATERLWPCVALFTG